MYWDAFVITAVFFGIVSTLILVISGVFLFGNMFCKYMERLFDDNIFLWLTIVGSISFAVLYLFVLGALAAGNSKARDLPLPDPKHKVQVENDQAHVQ